MSPEDAVQAAVEKLVQWDAFQKIWSESTPHQKEYVRDVLRGMAETSYHARVNKLVTLVEELLEQRK